MEPSEFVVTMLAANLATVAIEDPEAVPIYGILAILTILGGELTLSLLTLRFRTMRRLLCGSPVVLIEKGRVIQKNLKRTRVTLEELTAMLRQQQVSDLAAVRYAILETNGALSLFLFARDRPATAGEAGLCPEEESLPIYLVEDGTLVRENLRRLGISQTWVREELARRGAGLRDTLLLSIREGGKLQLIRREEEP